MKIKVSDYIADFFISKGIPQVFTVVGGGAMHLNDSFGHNPKIHCLYNHHEQASAMAAECYARVADKPAIVCVTSGPGALNALNGVVGAYQDSISMIVISGQVKTSLTMKSSGLHLRTYGGQEFPIVDSLQNMVKYAEMVDDASKIRYCLEKAYAIATSGRKGPCWLDIPIDIQSSTIEPSELPGFEENASDKNIQSKIPLEKNIDDIIEKIKTAKRPVIYAGNGIRLAGAVRVFHSLVEQLKIPVVTCWNSSDLIATDSRYYCGRAGTMGNRAGNFAVQNSDLLICIGTRLGIYQVGYNVNTWARGAYTVVVDIDSEELKKKTIRADLPICADAKDFIEVFLAKIENKTLQDASAWLKICADWKENYPVVTEAQKAEKGRTNVYAFVDELSRNLPEKAITVVSNGSASVVGSAAYYIKDGDRFIMNCAISSMGYGLPASIGACIANGKKYVVCIEGDGSLMMNIQELQTATTNKLPIKLFVINNSGYHQIRLTQNNLFHNGLVGVGPESNDLGFPNFEKVADAFDFSYVRISNNEELKDGISKSLKMSGPVLCEVLVSTTQKFEPKSATKKLDDGTLVSPPLEDLAPFLPREELAENMIIPLLLEEK